MMLIKCKRKSVCRDDTIAELDSEIDSLYQTFYYYSISSVIVFVFIMVIVCILCRNLKRSAERTGLQIQGVEGANMEYSERWREFYEKNSFRECLLERK